MLAELENILLNKPLLLFYETRLDKQLWSSPLQRVQTLCRNHGLMVMFEIYSVQQPFKDDIVAVAFRFIDNKLLKDYNTCSADAKAELEKSLRM